MLLQTVEIDAFRNFTNKQSMAVDAGVTCLIGKNESGKTTILKALHRLHPANEPDRFDLTAMCRVGVSGWVSVTAHQSWVFSMVGC
ncbi:AAA family ATPase [Streptomyces sp. NPDC051132]|uniref:AAA family ATPase n=1 Tax=unclassified Streptomyces TaxID=2593676 RepID=UPI00343218BD